MAVTRRRPADRDFDLLDVTVVDRVMQEYATGTLVGVTPIVQHGEHAALLSAKSTTSRKIVVETTAGTFFLKEVPWYCDDEARLGFASALMGHLAKCGIPVPLLVPARNGAMWASLSGSHFTLSEYCVGMPYSDRDDEFRAAASTLARCHSFSVGLSAHPFAPEESLLAIGRSHLELATQYSGSDETAAAAISWMSEEVERLFGGLRSPRLLPVHGDFIPWNLAFGDGCVTAVYDFDNCCLDSHLHDLGEAIVAFCCLEYDDQTSRLTVRGWNSPSATRVAMFLDSYESVERLSDQDREALKYYILGNWWECLLLSYIRRERSLTQEEAMAVQRAVASLWLELGLNSFPTGS